MSSADKTKVVKDPCIDCGEGVVKKTGGVQCNLCEEWSHPKCAKVSTQHLNALREQSGMTWTCTRCRKIAMKLQKQVHALSRKVDELESKVKINTDEITRLEKKILLVEKKAEKVDKESIVKSSLAACDEEQRNQENRRSNVVIYQIPEPSENLTGIRKKEHDMSKVIETLESIGCEITDSDVKFLVRLNSAQNNRSETRPILLGLRNTKKRDEIIKNAYTLIQNESNISIIPDLTPFQRQQERDLKAKATKLNDELDDDERLNWEWRLVGLKGQKRLIKTRKRQEQRQDTNSRGPRSRPPGKGAPNITRNSVRARNKQESQQIQTTSLNSSVMLPQESDDEEEITTVSQIPDQTR